MRYREIVEAYAHGFLTFRGQQCDVFRNPSRKEWRQVSGKNGEVRAFLVGQDILVWNTFAALHQMVRDEMALPRDVIPLVIYGAPGGECEVMVTDNSRDGPWHHNGEVADVIHEHPYLSRVFRYMSISYYDEDIVGDWRDGEEEED